MAAEQGLNHSQYSLGFHYENGKGVPKNDRLAFNWYMKAALQGLIKAQLKVGSMYGKGQGVLQNDEEAMKWLRRAAGQNSTETARKLQMAQSLFYLGADYEHGHNVLQSDSLSLQLVHESSSDGLD